jgi:regulator of RNase E activity RraA
MNEQVEKEYEEYLAAGRIWGIVPKAGIKKIKFPRIDKKIIDGFMELEDLTGTVSDILDSLGVKGVVPASYLSPIVPGKKIVGTAVTLRSIPERKTATQGLYDKDFIRMASRETHYLSEPGDILVADCGGDLNTSNMGGQSVAAAVAAGVIGAIFNGAVRDIPTYKQMDFPAWSKGRTPITGKCRIQAVEINGPVTLHDVLVEAGDLIIADDSGVCVVPADKAEYVLKKAQETCADEAVMREMIDNKAPVSELKLLFRKRYK